MPQINVIYRGRRTIVQYDVDPADPGSGLPFEDIYPTAALDMSASFTGTPIEIETREQRNELASLVAQARRQRAADDEFERGAAIFEDRQERRHAR